MEQFIREIRNYAAGVGKSPQWVLRQAIGANWGQWDSWIKGASSPTLHTADRLRRWMEQNPPPESAAPEEAAA